MQKKILLAVDDTIHSKNAIHYAVKISNSIRKLSFTLFSVQPTVSQYLLDEAKKNVQAAAQLKKVIQKNTEACQDILEKHRQLMIGLGVEEKRIVTSTQPKMMGLAKDIIEFGEKQMFDAILVGRRGLSKIQEAFMGSVTSNIIEHCRIVPVWLVDGQVSSERIMVAVDGSESALRAVDHLSFMIGNNRGIRIALFHVIPKAGDYCVVDTGEKAALEAFIRKSDRECIDHFYSYAIKKFSEAGISEKQIEVKTVKRTTNVGKAILSEAKKGDFGTVVIGRRGVSRAFFMGSVSRYVVDKMSDRAVWLVS
jgi:nucleotide-binding universal stress UspA family protein